MDQGFCIIEKLPTAPGARSDFRYIVANPAFERHSGLKDVVGKTIQELVPSAEAAILERYDAVAATRIPQRFQDRVGALDLWMDAEVFPARLPGQIAVLFTNITDRKRQEEALGKSEERFRALATAGATSIYRMSPDWRIMYEMGSTGFLAETAEPIEDWVDRYILPEDRSTVNEAIEQAIRTRSMFELEHRVALADGGLGWVVSRAVPMLGPDGKIVEWFGAGGDITPRKRVEEALRESAEAHRQSEERLRQFGEASKDILWIRDAETLQWSYLTPAFETVYGLSRSEALVGDNFRNWQNLILPQDREHTARSIRRVGAGEHLTFEYRVRRPVDGEIRWLRETDFPIVDAAGKVVMIGGIGHDFTELREAEGRLQTLVEGIPQLVWRAVDGGQWTWASRQWTDYTGQKEPDSHGRGWLEALHSDDRAASLDAWNSAVYAGGFEVECRLFHAAERDYRWFQTRATPVRDQSGAIIEWLGTSTDIHAIRELHERQEVLVAELQHRTRNLMGVVRSTADKTARSSADLADFRGRFRDRLNALARVQGLLSRLKDHDRVTFDELIDAELAAMAAKTDRVTVAGPAGIRLRSSTVQTLAMAVHELATNAVKYGALGQPQGRLSITWSLEPLQDEAEPWLHIDWRETGVTMPTSGAAALGSGQGRELIERALPYQLGARTSYSLGTDGVRCTLAVPISASAAGEERVHA